MFGQYFLLKEILDEYRVQIGQTNADDEVDFEFGALECARVQKVDEKHDQYFQQQKAVIENVVDVEQTERFVKLKRFHKRQAHIERQLLDHVRFAIARYEIDVLAAE